MTGLLVGVLSSFEEAVAASWLRAIIGTPMEKAFEEALEVISEAHWEREYERVVALLG